MQMTLEEAIGYVASDELIEASFVFCSNIYLVQKIYLILFCEDRAVFAK
jgi:predicted membrane GTPase involved in stress response